MNKYTVSKLNKYCQLLNLTLLKNEFEGSYKRGKKDRNVYIHTLTMP